METKATESPLSNCYLEVDCRAIAGNLEALRRKTKSTIMAVVKNNGYGLSLMEYARLLTGLGIRNLAAGSFEEAIALAEGGTEASILLLTPQASPAAAKELLLRGVTMTVGSLPQAETLSRAAMETGVKPAVHIKIDTGLGRYGFLPEELQYVPTAVKDMDVRGIYTHFSSPYASARTTRRQYETFLRAVEQLEYNGVPADLLHCCASGALLNYPDMHLDMVRAGSALLGRVPDARVHGLTPAVHLKAPVMAIKPTRSGAGIGYRNAVGLKRSDCIGVLSVGCACGLPAPRRAAGLLRRKQYAVINSQRAEILGPLGIGALAVNLTGLRCSEGDMARLDINPLYCAANIQRVYDRNLPELQSCAQQHPARLRETGDGGSISLPGVTRPANP